MYVHTLTHEYIHWLPDWVAHSKNSTVTDGFGGDCRRARAKHRGHALDVRDVVKSCFQNHSVLGNVNMHAYGLSEARATTNKRDWSIRTRISGHRKTKTDIPVDALFHAVAASKLALPRRCCLLHYASAAAEVLM